MKPASPMQDTRIAVCCADLDCAEGFAALLQAAGYPHVRALGPPDLDCRLPAEAGEVDLLLCDAAETDPRAPTASPLDWERVAHRLQPNIGVIALTRSENPRSIVQCIRRGALNCYLLSDPQEILLDIVSESIRRSRRGISPYRNASERRTAQLIYRLQQVIEEGGIDIQFQPIVRCGAWDCDRVEILARWNDAELGSVPPNQFIAIAEEHGLIEGLGRIVLRKSLDAMTALRRLGHRPRYSINLSRLQFDNTKLVQEFVHAVEAAGEEPGRITIEVTETARFTNDSLAIALMQDFLEAGFQLAVDDFGTGESSFVQMSHVAYNELKVDRSLIACIFQPAGLSILRSVISMARALDMSLVAEGVEDRQTAELLESLDIDYCQGYHFSRPMSLEELTAFLDRQRREQSQRSLNAPFPS